MNALRRNATLVLALLLIVGVDYVLFRLRPQLTELDQLDERITGLETELTDLDAKVPRGADAELQRLYAELRALRAPAADTALHFAQGEDLRDLACQLAALAEASGLALHEHHPAPRTVPVHADLPTVWTLDAYLAQHAPDRPRETWTARGSYHAVWTFLDGLRRLPHAAAVSHVEIARTADDLPLRVQLTLAL